MKRGGKRTGAGRPKGTNHYGEPTKPCIIPVSKIDRVLRFVRDREDMVPFMAMMSVAFHHRR